MDSDRSDERPQRSAPAGPCPCPAPAHSRACASAGSAGRPDIGSGDAPAAEGDDLIENRERVAHAPFAPPRDDLQRFIIGFDFFRLANLTQTPDQLVDDTAQVFLGVRINCAQCHHHPYEKWGQDDYWGLAAFFGRVGRKNLPQPGGFQNQQYQLVSIFSRSNGGVQNKRTGKVAPIKPLDGAPMDVPAGEDPRQKLVDWMVDAKK